MIRLPRSITVAALLALASPALVAGPASALTLRAPQVVFNYGPLQGYLNAVDPGINVATDQFDAQVWSSSLVGGSDFTLVLQLPLVTGASVGVYDASAPMGPVPTLLQVFPSAAVPGWFAVMHFGHGNLTVTMFDQDARLAGITTYPGLSPDHFAFYVQTSGGPVWFSQDARNNPAGTQMLTYADTEIPGDYWLCWEALPYSVWDSSFESPVIYVYTDREPPAPTRPTTWGKVKGKYR